MCYFDYDYDAASRIVSIARENGGIIYYGYDDADRLTSEQWRGSDNSLIYAFAWDYDPVGNRTYQSQVGFNGGTAQAPAQTYYDYDAANQLTHSRQVGGDSPGHTYYEYDSRGNCLRNHGPLGAQYFTYDDRNLVSSIRFRDGSSTYFEHDAQMRMSSMTEIPTGGGTSSATYFTWDSPSTGLGSGGINLLTERDQTGNLTARYVHGYTPIDGSGSTVAATKSTPTGDATQLFLYNHHGDVMAVLDETGAAIATYAYTAWGQPLSPAPMVPGGNRLRWQANWMYLKEDVYISMARVYDAGTGRFGQRDPVDGSGPLKASGLYGLSVFRLPVVSAAILARPPIPNAYALGASALLTTIDPLGLMTYQELIGMRNSLLKSPCLGRKFPYNDPVKKAVRHCLIEINNKIKEALGKVGFQAGMAKEAQKYAAMVKDLESKVSDATKGLDVLYAMLHDHGVSQKELDGLRKRFTTEGILVLSMKDIAEQLWQLRSITEAERKALEKIAFAERMAKLINEVKEAGEALKRVNDVVGRVQTAAKLVEDFMNAGDSWTGVIDFFGTLTSLPSDVPGIGKVTDFVSAALRDVSQSFSGISTPLTRRNIAILAPGNSDDCCATNLAHIEWGGLCGSERAWGGA